MYRVLLVRVRLWQVRQMHLCRRCALVYLLIYRLLAIRWQQESLINGNLRQALQALGQTCQAQQIAVIKHRKQ